MPLRPKGEVIWLHAADSGRFSLLNDLIVRLKTNRDGIFVLLTLDGEHQGQALRGLPALEADSLICLQNVSATTARMLVDHWHPDACLWIGGMFRSVLVSEMANTGCLMLSADVDESDLQIVRRSWFPGRSVKTLDCFSQIYVRNAATSRAVRRHGVDHRKITVAGTLKRGAVPPPVFEDQLNEIVEDLAGRPLWLAVDARRDEIEPILLAHRNAIRMSHRLLLILLLSDEKDVEIVRTHVEDLSLRSTDWDAGDALEDATQVIHTASTEEIGLWYRLAPLTLLANSLSEPCRGVDPMPAAALGTALLKGPYVKSHSESYSRLAKAGAVETVRDADSLTKALVRLIAPDRAAMMALAGWEVATEGAELADKLIDAINDGLDRREAENARA